MQERISRTIELIHSDIKKSEPYEGLVHILESALELVQLPDSEFCWSYWDNEEAASREINKLLKIVREEAASRDLNRLLKIVRLVRLPRLPLKFKLDVLFMGTGALQEVSMSSGWSDLFMRVAAKYDQVAKSLWEDVS